MTFAGAPLSVVGPALAAGAAALVALYLLKLRRRRLEVPFAELWRRVLSETQSTALWKRLRRIVSLAVAARSVDGAARRHPRSAAVGDAARADHRHRRRHLGVDAGHRRRRRRAYAPGSGERGGAPPGALARRRRRGDDRGHGCAAGAARRLHRRRSRAARRHRLAAGERQRGRPLACARARRRRAARAAAPDARPHRRRRMASRASSTTARARSVWAHPAQPGAQSAARPIGWTCATCPSASRATTSASPPSPCAAIARTRRRTKCSSRCRASAPRRRR